MFHCDFVVARAELSFAVHHDRSQKPETNAKRWMGRIASCPTSASQCSNLHQNNQRPQQCFKLTTWSWAPLAFDVDTFFTEQDPSAVRHCIFSTHAARLQPKLALTLLPLTKHHFTCRRCQIRQKPLCRMRLLLGQLKLQQRAILTKQMV